LSLVHITSDADIGAAFSVSVILLYKDKGMNSYVKKRI
jgi:hypothetical protein